MIAQTTAFSEQTLSLYALREELMFKVAPHMEQFERPRDRGRVRWAWDWVWGRT